MGSLDTIDHVLKVVSVHYDVLRADIVSARRTSRVLPARLVGIYLAQRLSGAPTDEIGRRFGGRVEGQVLMACRATRRLADDDPQHAEVLQALEQRVLAASADVRAASQ